MKTIGLLGGMSWESTQTYYALINRAVNQKLGGFHSAKIVMVSVDFAEIERLQVANDWPAAAELLGAAAKQIEAAGADFLLICTNTMHEVYESICASVKIPVMHIADATANRIQELKLSKVGLLGTQFTMQRPFYRERLKALHGIDVITPSLPEQSLVHSVIYDELCRGVISDSSRQIYRDVIANLVHKGAEAVILGCTEIGLLVSAEDASVPLVDTTEIHAFAAVYEALND
jgi:aspartate racemase